MKQHIPENIIEEVRTRTDVVAVVSDTVVLKKSGTNFKGLCPFHSEKTPSFTVSPEKQIYHCFGCGAGGNAFKFLMETQNISFVEAVKSLAAKAQISIPTPARSGSENQRDKERERTIGLNRLAGDFFSATLKHPTRGKKALEYLNSREINGETLDQFQIGWAGPNWDDLLNALVKKTQCSRADLEKAGLVKQKDGSPDRFYDRFRSRIIIPLKDLYGNIIGFGGRLIEPGEPKYLNSPETLIYKKGKQLFGLNLAKDSIRREKLAIVVEGYFDQIRAFQKGIKNVVATCGTALTPDQARLLKNHTTNAVLVFDSDPAGKLAAERGFEVLLEQDFNVKMVVLPQGQDPDSYIREAGPEKFLQEIKNARPFLESYIDGLIEKNGLETPSGRMNSVNGVLPLLKKVKSNLERGEWVKYVSEKIGVADKALLKELNNALTQNQTLVKRAPETTARVKAGPEFYLIHLLLLGKNVRKELRGQVSLDEFSDPGLRQAAELIYECIDSEQPVEIDRLLDQTDNTEIKALLTRIGFQPIAFDNWEKATADCIRQLRKKNVEQKIKELKRLRNEAEKAGESEQSRKIHAELQKMQLSLIPG